jgi:NAD(P)H-nitrite reductase large subunit
MHVVVIGSGIGGITFAEKYRALVPHAQITLLTSENLGYYARPLLSHGFSRDNIEQTIVLKSFAALREHNIAVIGGVTVTGIDRGNRLLTVSGAQDFTGLAYDTLILALGSEAFVPPPLQSYQGLFFVLNSLADLKVLRSFRHGILEQHRPPRWAMIGGGLIGCEVASDLAVAGDKVSLFHMMDRLMERQLAEQDSHSLLGVLQASGVDVLLNQSVQGFEKSGAGFNVLTAAEKRGDFDGIIVACGFKPRTALAAGAGLQTGRGIKTDQFLRTGDAGIYALGDVAELPNGKLYAFIRPILEQAQWLAKYLSGQEQQPWQPPVFSPKAKVHGFEAEHPYIF